jgi:hypothetical protein
MPKTVFLLFPVAAKWKEKPGWLATATNETVEKGFYAVITG